MTDLIEFLRARLDEDDRMARLAADRDGEHWEVTSEGDLVTPGTGGSGYFGTGPWGSSLGETGAHIARHDPARVLAEVDAKRRILDRYEDCRARLNDLDYSTLEAAGQLREYEDFVLPPLALLYADHPDYREEWRP